MENILLGSNSRIMIADFGVSVVLEHTKQIYTAETGTLYYMPPEMFEEGPRVSKAADIYALGIILYLLLNNCMPYMTLSLILIM